MNKNPGEYGIAAGTDTTSGDTADTNNNDQYNNRLFIRLIMLNISDDIIIKTDRK